MKAILALFNFAMVLGFAWLAGVDPKRGVVQAVVLAVALLAAYSAKFQTAAPKWPNTPVMPSEKPMPPRVTDIPPIH